MSHNELSQTTSTTKRHLALGLAGLVCFVAVMVAAAWSVSTKSVVASGSVGVLALQADVAPVVLPTSTPTPANPAPVAAAVPVTEAVLADTSVTSAVAPAELAAAPAAEPMTMTEAPTVEVEPVTIDTPIVEAPPVSESAPVVEAPPVVEAAPVVQAPAPVVQAPAPVVQAAPVIAAVAPSSTRNGPADVINQLPESAFRWLEANNWTVQWRQGPGPGRQAEAQYATSTIVIWHDNSYSSTTWAGAFAHELGHAVSYVHFNNAQMDEWNTMRGLASWRWVPGTPNDFSVGEGDFAESFMSYLLGHSPRSAGGQLTPTQAAWIAANTPF